jgi:hypothetical protein
MQTRHSVSRILALALVLAQCGTLALAQNAGLLEHWVATWAASPQQPPGAAPGGRGQRGPAPAAPAPVIRGGATPAPAAGATAPAAPGAPRGRGGAPQIANLNDQTIRMFIRTSLGGQRVRVQFSNAYGSAPLSIGAAHIALRSKDSAIISGSNRALSFNGKPSVRIPVGASVFE